MKRHPRLISLKWRLMWPLALFTLAVSALFGFFAMVFIYTVEDKFMEGMLQDEANVQRAHFANHGDWVKPQRDFVALHRAIDSMPTEVREALAKAPQQREIAGNEGRHYHLLAITARSTSAESNNRPNGDARVWLLAEVSGELVVRPRRDGLVRWFVGWGIAATLVSLVLAMWLARRVSKSIEGLARRVANMLPDHVSEPLSVHATGGAEVAQLARAFDALTERTRAFLEREQRFTRDASHELRTPLSVLRLSIERLQSDAATSHEVAASLATMHASVHLMEQTVASLLALARENEGGLGAADTAVLPLLEAWIVANENWLSARAANIDIRVEPTARLPMPGAALHLAIANLLGNAVAHGDNASPIVVSLYDGALTIENRVPETEQSQAVERNGDRDGHGIGLTIVQRTLARFGYEVALVGQRDHVRAIVRARDVHMADDEL
jgi:signal transduction histidine kinase